VLSPCGAHLAVPAAPRERKEGTYVGSRNGQTRKTCLTHPCDLTITVAFRVTAPDKGGKRMLTAFSDGRHEVFGVGPDGNLGHMWQTAPNNAWSGRKIWARRSKVSRPSYPESTDPAAPTARRPPVSALSTQSSSRERHLSLEVLDRQRPRASCGCSRAALIAPGVRAAARGSMSCDRSGGGERADPVERVEVVAVPRLPCGEVAAR